MHYITKAILSVAAAAAIAFSGYAIPAKPGILQYTNPDGSSVELSISGDENGYHYMNANIERDYRVAMPLQKTTYW